MYAQEPTPHPNEFTEDDARAVAIRSLQARAASTAKTLNLVAAFSIANSLLGMVNAPFGLAFGLCITDIIDGIAKSYHAPFMGLLFDLIPVGYYFLLAFLLKKHWGWFVVAMVSYLIDGLLALALLQGGSAVYVIVAVLVHGYVLYLLWQGMTAARAARNLQLMPSGQNR